MVEFIDTNENVDVKEHANEDDGYVSYQCNGSNDGYELIVC